MADTPKLRFESKMLIDVKLVGRQNRHAGFDPYPELESVAYPAA